MIIISIQSTFFNTLFYLALTTEQLEIIIDRYQRIIYYKEKTFANTLRNGIFENLKNLYSTQAQAGIDTFEVNYWSEKGYFDKTLEDVLD